VTLKDSLLSPLALLYGAAAHVRARAYRRGILRKRRLDGIVVSVGNLTTGGTGKTPMVLWITQRLLAEGKRVGILTRGYRGGTSSAGSTSDEVQLIQARLGERVAFGVGADRYARGRELAKRGIEWFVLDDGFQHLQLARDVDIVLIDATNPFGGGRLLPAGRLREPRSALARADIVVITRSSHAPAVEGAIGRDSDVPIFYARPQLDSIRNAKAGSVGEGDSGARSKRLFAFCGIGNPSAFLADLREWNFQIIGHKFFPDHHRYTQQEVDALVAEARAAGAEALLCTEKDIFNFADIRWGTADVFYGCISLRIEREDEFWGAVMAAAQRRARSLQ
jgi:tetraacyldisaccharide 4'-kinase